MDVGMTMDELAARLPLPKFISITDAAKILGGGKTRVRMLMDEAIDGYLLKCWSHLIPNPNNEHSRINWKFVPREGTPFITPDTDPSTVLVLSKEILWRWSCNIQGLLFCAGKEELEPLASVDARLAALNARAYELKTGSKPALIGSADSGTAPVSRWPWGNHHTEALGHLEAAALRFWGANYDFTDPTTAPTNEQVWEWLEKERKVSSERLRKSIASILRLDGMKSGPR